jgi:hypothetical protein
MAKDSEKWRDKEAIVCQKCVSSFDELPSHGVTKIPPLGVTLQKRRDIKRRDIAELA